MDKNRRPLLVVGKYICCFTLVEFIILTCLSIASIPLAVHFLRSAPGTPVNTTDAPTGVPSETPSMAPTLGPTQTPTTTPTFVPTLGPTQKPTNTPTFSPTTRPTLTPSGAPSEAPTIFLSPTNTPSGAPTQVPTGTPTSGPTNFPTTSPTGAPTFGPTNSPTTSPTGAPTTRPTQVPTTSPTGAPTFGPTQVPTNTPTGAPTTAPPTIDPLTTEFCIRNISENFATDVPNNPYDIICWNGMDYCTYPIILNFADNTIANITSLSQMNSTIQSKFGSNYVIDLSNGCFYSTNGTAKRLSPYNDSVHGFFEPDFFITKWNVTSPGNNITLPIRRYNHTTDTCNVPGFGGQIVYLDIDWGDSGGTFQRFPYNFASTTTISHTYNSSGIFIVRIGGRLHYWSRLAALSTNSTCAVGSPQNSLIDILQFGNVVRVHMDFYYEVGLPATINASDAPWFGLNSMSHMFRSATNPMSLSMSNWGFDNVIYTRRMFEGQSNPALNATTWTFPNLNSSANMFRLSNIFISLANRQFPRLEDASGMFFGITYNGSITLDNLYAPVTTTWVSAFNGGSTFSSISAVNMTIRGALTSMFSNTKISGNVNLANMVSPGPITFSANQFFFISQINGTVNVANLSLAGISSLDSAFSCVYMPNVDFDMSSWSIPNITSLVFMFRISGCTSIPPKTTNSITLSGLSMPKVTSIVGFLFGQRVVNIYADNLIMPLCTSLSFFCDGCVVNGTISVKNWTMPSVQTISNFVSTGSFANGPDTTFWPMSFPNLTDFTKFAFNSAFSNATFNFQNRSFPVLLSVDQSFRQITGGGAKINFANAQMPGNLTTTPGTMFYSSNIASFNGDNWYMPLATNFNNFFASSVVTGSFSMTNLGISTNLSIIMTNMFYNANFSSGGPLINTWNMASVSDISFMFFVFTTSPSSYSAIFNWTGLNFAGLTAPNAADACLPSGSIVTTPYYDIFLSVMNSTSNSTFNDLTVTSCYTNILARAALVGRNWTFMGDSFCIGAAPSAAPSV